MPPRTRRFSDVFRNALRSAPILVLLILAGITLTGCAEAIEELRDRYRPESLREAYALGLEEAGLADRAAGRLWLDLGDAALDVPVDPDIPYREAVVLDPIQPEAHAYSLDLVRGRRLVVELTLDSDPGTMVFADLFESLDDRGLGVRRVASADSTMRLEADIDRTGTYILRVQPELLARGRYEMAIRTEASIIFPVSGRSEYDIGSVFGDPRDGGRREHHGVDIFAPRGTPVVAAVDGTVRSTRTGGLGGKTVWLRSARDGSSFYYAHLDEQLVERGMRVSQGDTLGLVGNTGNARTTPPHLHFGIYSGGPTDPYPFMRKSRERAEPVRGDLEFLGRWMRIARDGTRFYRSGADLPSTDEVLAEHTSVRIVGAEGSRFRVYLPDGRHGYVLAADLESSEFPFEERVASSAATVRTVPAGDAPGVEEIAPGKSLPVIGLFGEYSHVATGEGRTGWVHGL